MKRRQLPLTEMERDELLQAVRRRRNNWVTYAPFLDMVHEVLREADVIPEGEWDGMVSLGSRVRVRRLRSGGTEAWELVGPGDDAMDDGRLSVLTPLGWELLGAREGDVVYAASMAQELEGHLVERVTAGGAVPGDVVRPARPGGYVVCR